MTATIRIGPHWIEAAYPVEDIKHSTIYRDGDYSGDFRASCRWAAPFESTQTLVRPDQTFRVVDNGVTLWGGVLTEPTYSDGVWELHAVGYGEQGKRFQAVVQDGVDEFLQPIYVPSTVPNAVVDQAIAFGAPWVRGGNLGDTAISDPEGQITDVHTLLVRAATAQGKRVHFDSDGVIRYVTDPTSPVWALTPGDGYIGTADDEFVTHLFGYYIDAVDMSTGLPTSYDSVLAADEEARIQFGYSARGIKLYNLGLMTEAAAQDYIDGKFALVGGRMAATNGVEINGLNLRRIGFDQAAARYVKAGEMLRIPGVMDTRLQPTTRASQDVVIGQVEVAEATGTAIATPVGFVPRDLVSALANPEKPEAVTEA